MKKASSMASANSLADVTFWNRTVAVWEQVMPRHYEWNFYYGNATFPISGEGDIFAQINRAGGNKRLAFCYQQKGYQLLIT